MGNLLVQFVRARLNEREALALAVRSREWHQALALPPHEQTWNEWDPSERDYILRHDPMWTIADIAAKRQILDLFEMSHSEPGFTAETWVCLRDVVYQLAAIDSAHPHYNPDWRTK